MVQVERVNVEHPARLKLWDGILHWAENQPDNPSLSEAIRRLVEMGLKAKPAR
jgi:hypothetical protein